MCVNVDSTEYEKENTLMATETLAQVLTRLDNTAEQVAEHVFAGEIRKAVNASSDSLSDEELGELMAFDFTADYQSNETGWGTYFGPMMVFPNGDVTSTESPSLSQVTPEILEYWATRAKVAKHPVLKARYAGLVWDFSRNVNGSSPDVELARIAIDSIVNIAEEDRHLYETQVIGELEHALSLAISVRECERIANVRDAMIAYEAKIAVDESVGTWGFSFDSLLGSKNISLDDLIKSKLIQDQVDRLERLTTNPSTNPMGSTVWAAESVATRLARHYRKMGQHLETRRALSRYFNSFEEAAQADSPLRASAWLQKVHSLFLEFQMKEEAEQVAIALQKIGQRANEGMKPITVEGTISSDELQKYVEEMIAGDLESALVRIATHYIPKKDLTEKNVKELAKKLLLPFLYQR